MVICKHCQAELPGHIQFCGRCGNSIAEETHRPTVIEVLGGQKGTPLQGTEEGDPTKFLSTDENLPLLPEERAVAYVPTVLLPVDVRQDQQQQDMQGAHAPLYASPVEIGPDGRPEDVSAKTENIAAELAFEAINLSPSQLMSEAPAMQPDGAGLGQHAPLHQPQVQHGAHHQPQIQHGAHHQPQIQHGAHHQPQIQHGAHHQPQIQHGAHHQPQIQHGVAHQAQGAHGAVHQAQAAHGLAHHVQHLRHSHIRIMKGCRPSCMTVIVSAGVALVVTASLLLLFLYILPGGAQPTLNIPASISVGEIITAQGTNFSPGQHILITIDTQQKAQKDEPASLARANLLDSVRVATLQQQQGIPLTVKSDGTFTTTIQADPVWNVGSQHTLYISRQDGSLIVRKQFTIKAGSPQLALCSVNASNAAITLGPVVAGQSASISMPFKLCTRGSGQVDWSSSWDMKQAPWLLLMKSGHVQAPQTLLLQFGASAASLKVGKYTTTVTFSSLKSSLKITLKVTLVVQDKNTCIQSGTTNLTLTSVPGQGSPAQQSVMISNCGESGDWTAVSTTDDGASWLSVNPGNGTLQKGASQYITVGATAANLVAGTYTGHVVFGSGPNAGHIDVTFVVTNTPQAKPPCLTVNTGQLNFTANAQGSDPAAQGVTISNPCGAGSWSASIDQSWLGLSTVSGNIDANGSINLNVQASIANLAAGTYTGHVTFSPGSATVTVILNVQAVPCISAQSSIPLLRVMEGNTSSSVPETIFFVNGCGSGNWTAESDVPWITFTSASSGSINAGARSSVALNINENAVGLGNFTGHITFSPPGSYASVVGINLTVYQRLCIQASVASLSFTAQAGYTPGSQVFSVSNCAANAGTLSVSNITTDDGANWLHVTGGGPLGVGGVQRFVVAPSAMSLRGNYTGHIYITITGSDGGIVTIRIDVTYNVYILT